MMADWFPSYSAADDIPVIAQPIISPLHRGVARNVPASLYRAEGYFMAGVCKDRGGVSHFG